MTGYTELKNIQYSTLSINKLCSSAKLVLRCYCFERCIYHVVITSECILHYYFSLLRLREYEFAILNGYQFFIESMERLGNVQNDTRLMMQFNMDFANKFEQLGVIEALANIYRISAKESNIQSGESDIFTSLREVNYCGIGMFEHCFDYSLYIFTRFLYGRL